MSLQQTNKVKPIDISNMLSILDTIDEIIYITDPQTYEIVYCNHSLIKALGLKHSPVGQKCYKVIQDNDTPCSFCNNEKILQLATGDIYNWEFQHTKNKRWYACKGQLIAWNDGRMLHMETANDISKIKATTQELEESKERYSLATTASDNGIWDWWTDSEEVYYSPQWKAQLGYKDHEIANNFQEWSDLLHDEDKERMHQAVQRFLENPKDFFIEEFRMKHKDGTYRWIRNRAAAVLNDEGKVIRMFGTHKNITQEKKLNQELRKTDLMYRGLIENAPDGIVMLNSNYKLIFFSPSALNIFGYTKEDAKTISLNTLLHPDEIDQVKGKLEKVTNNAPHHLDSLEHRIRTSNGLWRWIESSFSMSIDEQGEAALVINFRDIEERKKQEKELQQAKMKAEKASLYKDQFLTNMSHDIRTPINGIIGFSDLLDDDNISPEKRKRYIEIIKSSSNQLLNLINDIIDTSKIEIGELKLHYHPCNIPELLNNLHSTFDLLKQQKDRDDIAINCHIPEEYDNLSINTDAARLQQVLSNLIGNALKFTKHSIDFGFNIDAQEITFFVKDDGIGIPKNKRDNIFKRFEQVRDEDATKHGGTGLGLAISKGIIELMQGKINVESKVHKGSTFTFSLPFDAVEDSSRSKKNQTKERVKDKNKKIRILIAEDQTINIEYFKVILKEYPFKLSVAKNGKEAVEIYKANPDIDLVLMDIRMPVMDGLEATKQILEFDPKAKIIAQTAFAMAQDAQHFLLKGCIDYLSKPITKEELLEMINKWS